MHNVPGDGNCLFSSIAYIILKNTGVRITSTILKNKAIQLRKKTMKVLENELKKNNEELIMQISTVYTSEYTNSAKFTTNLNKMKENVKKYIKIMSRNTSWGGHIELFGLGQIVHKLGYKGIQVYDLQVNSKNNNSNRYVKSKLPSNKVLKGKLVPISNFKTKFVKKHKKLIRIILHGVENGGYHFDPLFQYTNSSIKISNA